MTGRHRDGLARLSWSARSRTNTASSRYSWSDLLSTSSEVARARSRTPGVVMWDDRTLSAVAVLQKQQIVHAPLTTCYGEKRWESTCFHSRMRLILLRDRHIDGVATNVALCKHGSEKHCHTASLATILAPCITYSSRVLQALRKLCHGTVHIRAVRSELRADLRGREARLRSAKNGHWWRVYWDRRGNAELTCSQTASMSLAVASTPLATIIWARTDLASGETVDLGGMLVALMLGAGGRESGGS